MSSTLMWQPVDMNKKALSDELKHALQKRDEFNGPEGRMDESSISYLKGLRDAGIKDADKLIKAIGKHGEIELSLEW